MLGLEPLGDHLVLDPALPSGIGALALPLAAGRLVRARVPDEAVPERVDRDRRPQRAERRDCDRRLNTRRLRGSARRSRHSFRVRRTPSGAAARQGRCPAYHVVFLANGGSQWHRFSLDQAVLGRLAGPTFATGCAPTVPYTCSNPIGPETASLNLTGSRKRRRDRGARTSLSVPSKSKWGSSRASRTTSSSRPSP